MSTLRSLRNGFALPMVIVVMFALVSALAGGFALLSTERASDDATVQGQTAAALAETGLQQGLSNRVGLGLPALPVGGGDSVRVTVDGGYYDVITTELRPMVSDVIPGIYVVRARGVRTFSGVANAGNSVAMVSAFGIRKQVSLTVQSAMTGINGIKKAGSSGLISGHDVCGAKASLPGVAVPEDPGIDGTGQWEASLDGSSKWTHIGATEEDASESVPIDWDAIVNGGSISADFRVPAVAFPDATWFTDNPTAYPTIIVTNGPDPSTEWSLPNFGRGLLIIFGNLDLGGNMAGWDGLILVGGRLTSNGANEVQGGVITGLNVKLGLSVENNDVNELNGTKKFLYNSCKVASALNGGTNATIRAWQNTFSNTYPTY
jgi:hypothetical protein